MDGLETISEVLVALADGSPVPQRSAEFLAKALRPCLAGDNNIADRLGLRAPGRGRAHQAPATLKRKLHRDHLVRAVITDMGGTQVGTNALALGVLWLHCWAQNIATDAVQSKNLNNICELASDYGPPLSHRQIMRVARGDTAYTRRH